jgi:hypothetical protein
MSRLEFTGFESRFGGQTFASSNPLRDLLAGIDACRRAAQAIERVHGIRANAEDTSGSN